MLSRKEIRRRQLKGIAAAKKNGKYHGKPTKYTANNKKIKKAFYLYFKSHVVGDCFFGKFEVEQSKVLNPNYLSMQQIADKVGISRQTLYRKLQQLKPKPQDYLSTYRKNAFITSECDRWIINHDPNGKAAKAIFKRINDARRYYEIYIKPTIL